MNVKYITFEANNNNMNKQELEALIDQRVEALKKELLSKLETNLPDTGWVISDNNSIIFKTSATSGFGYLISTDGWYKSIGWHFNNEWHAATPEEMETKVLPMLKKEAEKRGYKEGVFIKSLFSDFNIDLSFEGLYWKEDGLWLGSCLILNTKGEWAKIITEPDYDVEVKHGLLNVRIGKIFAAGKYRLIKID